MITTPTRPGASKRAVFRFFAAMASAAVLAGCGTLWLAAQAKAEPESYVVFDSNVLPDEPGWLPAGTVTLR
ncbi:hypothetical protein [Mycolicibacterium senegalense]|uniref:Uncharacterized protein n=1 Tax=Mycolicibacterium senegalense TaxID=1796 RepID=A0ABR5G1G9_9MYCO|nr:hypothetical protein [Mycolicibacterium senegalense]KLI05772.1 hypothetical protein AA982_22685 [Mycolicibacterium senegalense]KLO54056.1 hypothetical protein ABW05_23855 [Mycolicibacterium senegalense]KLO54122.1 hypothetical protein ABW05_24295 [Mycolicibacterium senegalense]